jgi:hypothetical protein
MKHNPSSWKLSLIGFSLMGSAGLFYVFQHRDLPENIRIQQFIATCSSTLGVSTEECQTLLDQWGSFFKR